MIDLLVSLAIVGVLIALMLPAISMVRESTRKVICASNLRQVGLGVNMYSQDMRDRLPDSVFLPPVAHSEFSTTASFDRMDTVWLSLDEFPERRDDRWDGLGILFGEEYISAANIYYCPSHQGNFNYADAQDDWRNLSRPQEIIVNYLYRGTGPNGSRVLFNIEPGAAMVSDTLRSFFDLNHEGGFNVLSAGLAVNWVEDIGDEIANDLLLRGDDGNKSNTVQDAWGRLDNLPTVND